MLIFLVLLLKQGITETRDYNWRNPGVQDELMEISLFFIRIKLDTLHSPNLWRLHFCSLVKATTGFTAIKQSVAMLNILSFR